MTTGRGTGQTSAGELSEIERHWHAGSWAEARAERERLVAMGDAGVPALVLALRSEDDQVRWEAARGLVDVHSAAAGPALVEALDDQSGGVRWLAAEGLIELGPASLDPLLHALMQHSELAWLREGAHHVLVALGHGQLWPIVQPVVRALESVEPAIGVLVPARNALDALRAATK